MDATKWEPRRVGRDEHARVSDVLGRAFADDPMWRWALGRPRSDERQARLTRFFDTLVRRVYARKELMFIVDGEVAAGVERSAFAGAAVWTPPGAWHFSLADEARVATGVLRAFGAAGTVRLLKLLAGVERAHLQEPHYYLFAIGADAAYQGRGVGAALMAPMLARCDDERVPAYLESSNPANLSFYRRHGFVATTEIRFGDEAVVTPMRRDPR